MADSVTLVSANKKQVPKIQRPQVKIPHEVMEQVKENLCGILARTDEKDDVIGIELVTNAESWIALNKLLNSRPKLIKCTCKQGHSSELGWCTHKGVPEDAPPSAVPDFDCDCVENCAIHSRIEFVE